MTNGMELITNNFSHIPIPHYNLNKSPRRVESDKQTKNPPNAV